MARSKGATKGRVVFVCEETATTSSYIAEPLVLNTAQFATMEAGGTFTGTITTDNSIKYAALSNGSVDDVTINDVYIGVGNAVLTTFGKTLTGTPVKPATLTVTAGGVTGTADAAGVITGAGITSGSVVNATGVFTVTFTAAVVDGTPVLVDYTRGV